MPFFAVVKDVVVCLEVCTDSNCWWVGVWNWGWWKCIYNSTFPTIQEADEWKSSDSIANIVTIPIKDWAGCVWKNCGVSYYVGLTNSCVNKIGSNLLNIGS